LRLSYALCSRHGSESWGAKMWHLGKLENTSAALLQSEMFGS